MEKRADVYGIGVLEKGRQLARNSSDILWRMGICLLGMLLSNAVLPGGLAPFGVAFAAAAPGTLLIPASLGAGLGYLLHFASGSAGTAVIQWGYLCGILLALWIVWAGRMVQGARSRRNRAQLDMLFRLVGAAFGVTAPALVMRLFTSLTVQDIFGLLSEGIAAAGACWMFSRMLRELEAGGEKADTGPILMTAGLAVAALSRICIYELSVGRSLALLGVLLCASCFGGRGRSGTGAAAGVAAGALVALCGVPKGFGYTLPGIWGLGGLMAGIFSPLGPGFLCAALLLGETAAVYLFAQDTRAYIILAEALLASGLYLLIPAHFKNLLQAWAGGNEAGLGGAVGDLLFSRLHGAGEALSDIAKATEAVADKLNRREERSDDAPEQIFRDTVQQVCRRCPDGAGCWAGHYDETIEGFSKMRDHLRRDKELSADTAASCFVRGCAYAEKLAVQAEQDFRTYLEKKERKRLSTRVRGVVTDQFEGLSLVMEGMERQLRTLHRCDRELEEQIRECCRKNHLDAVDVICCEDGWKRLKIELAIPSGQWHRLENARTLSTGQLTAQLGAICSRQLSEPEARTEDGMARLAFSEQPKYRLLTGCAQLSAGGAKVCGDVYSVFPDKERREVMLISDGMGTGSRAAMDSAMASGILSRLLRAGIEPDAALKLVNAALLVKSTEESLATIDLADIDLYTGQARFFKAGAAPTFLRRNGHGGSVEACSLPAGILKDVAFEQAAVSLGEGDMVVMVSDGAVQGDGDWITQELEKYQRRDPQRLAEHLARCAQARFGSGKEDDITVLVGMLAEA